MHRRLTRLLAELKGNETMEDPFNKDPDVAYGVAVDVAEGVRRITCQNASPYTFTGTQTYLVGQGDVGLIDPGPAHGDHLSAIMGALKTGERISHILVTHSHADHSPGASVIAQETGAEIYAYGAHGTGLSATMEALVAQGAEIGGGEGGDAGFQPDHILKDGDRVEAESWALNAVHTPGHLSNHLSFAMEETGVLFSGDMIMGFATTLVSPPDGDMAAFMDSLGKLSARAQDRLYLPGHGHPVADPHGMLDYQRAHRESRFNQIIEALGEGPKTAAALTKAIYTDIDSALLGAASRNVLASLIGLSDQGRVTAQGQIAVDAVFELT